MQKTFVQGSHLRMGFIEATIIVDHVIGNREKRVPAGLSSNYTPRLFDRVSVTRHYPPNPQLVVAIDDDNAIDEFEER